MIEPITITPELELGSEIWIMNNNYPTMGLIASYSVVVTTCTEHGRSWWDQLFGRYFDGRKQKEVYDFSFSYCVKMESNVFNYFNSLEKKNGRWYFLDKPVYFSKQELLESLK